jgi:hypothetical protein
VPVGFTVRGGRNVIFNLAAGEASTSNDFLWGAAAYLNGVKDTDAEVSYYMKYDKDGIAREQIGATLGQYLFNTVKIYANTRYDIKADVLNEMLAGVKLYPLSKLLLTGE